MKAGVAQVETVGPERGRGWGVRGGCGWVGSRRRRRRRRSRRKRRRRGRRSRSRSRSRRRGRGRGRRTRKCNYVSGAGRSAAGFG